jgi:hypothetical protein
MGPAQSLVAPCHASSLSLVQGLVPRAMSFTYDPKRSLYDWFSRAHKGEADEEEGPGSDSADTTPVNRMINPADSILGRSREDSSSSSDERSGEAARPRPCPSATFLSMFSLFEGSPSYRRRRRRQPKMTRKSSEEISDNSSSALPPYPLGCTQKRLDEFSLTFFVCFHLISNWCRTTATTALPPSPPLRTRRPEHPLFT